jgi:hypothetical protein
LVEIRKTATRIDWYVNGVAQTAQTTSSKIPTGNSGANFNASIQNGASNFDANAQIGSIQVIRAIN